MSVNTDKINWDRNFVFHCGECNKKFKVNNKEEYLEIKMLLKNRSVIMCNSCILFFYKKDPYFIKVR